MPTKKKKSKKRAVKKIPAKKTKRAPSKKKAAEKKSTKTKAPVLLGVVTHYFPQVSAAVVKLKAPLKIGDSIQIKGHTTSITQTITSMQIDRKPIDVAKKGQEIGLLVNSRVRKHDKVYQTKTRL